MEVVSVKAKVTAITWLVSCVFLLAVNTNLLYISWEFHTVL